jgi:hypothetical protein
MLLDLKEVLDQFRSWREAARVVRITKGSESWLSCAESWAIREDSILVNKNDELGTFEIRNFSEAYFRRVDFGLDATWPSGATISFREQSSL